MEKNWLIRTSQKQILGPVAKEKILELLKKGALSPLDEVASGNGYWFSLREKELVEKYLYGDAPQPFNPMSESKSVLGKKDGPEVSDVTVVGHTGILKLTAADKGAKLPSASDLEFPDVDMITSVVEEDFRQGGSVLASHKTLSSIQRKAVSSLPPVNEIAESPSAEKVVLPSADDLSFPDEDYKTSPKVAKGKVDLSRQHTRTVALDNHQAAEVLPEISAVPLYDLERDPLQKPLSRERKEESTTVLSKEKLEVEESKMAFHKKVKASVLKSPAAQRDPSREVGYKDAPESFKKRNDNYLVFILIILVLIIFAVVFYFKEILNKPLPV